MSADTVSIDRLFSECSNLLIEYDTKRDKVIEFYLVVVGGYLAAIKAAGLDQIMIMFLGLGTFLLGYSLTHSMMDYRIWHNRYSQTAKLLVALGQVDRRQYRQTEKKVRPLAYEDMDIEKDEQRKKDATRDPIHRFLFYFYWKRTGTEFQRYQTSLIITMFPLFIVLYSSLSIILSHCPFLNHPYLMLLIIVGSIISYYLASCYQASIAIYETASQCPWAYWLLDGLDLEWSFKDQKLRRPKSNNAGRVLP